MNFTNIHTDRDPGPDDAPGAPDRAPLAAAAQQTADALRRSGMSLHGKINLIFAVLTAIVLTILTALEMNATRNSVREEMEASSRVATHLLARISQIYAMGNLGNLASFLEATGRVRANDITLTDASGKLLYASPPSAYKAGRDAPRWYAALIMPPVEPRVIPLNGARLVVTSDPSRAVLDGWDNLKQMLAIGAFLFLSAEIVVFWLVGRWLAPLEVIRRGLLKMEQGDHAHRLPPLPGKEAGEMGRAFNRMAQAVEDNIEVRHASAEANARLGAQREFLQMLHQRIEEERAGIARELHDELGQSLTAIRSIAKSLLSHPEVKGGPIEPSIRMLFDTAGATSDAMHRLIPRLRPIQLDGMGLIDAVRDLVGDMQVMHPGIKIDLHCHGVLPDLPDTLEIHAYRIIQEALTNVARHAQATCVVVALGVHDQALTLSIADNGTGVVAALERPGHYGVRGMRERADSLGGKITFSRAAQGGLEINVVLPIHQVTT